MEGRGSLRPRATPHPLLLLAAAIAGAATLVLLALPAAAAASIRCDRRPKDVAGDPQPVNGRFRLEFSGKDNTYVPDHTYRVKLFGERHGPTNKNTFRVFTLFLEPQSFWTEYGTHHVGNLSTGGDSLITFGECANSVRQTSGRLKDSIEVLWRAPPAGSGCVFFRATVVEDTSKWYMDDDYLSLLICEEERMVYNRQPEIQDPCCACEEAKYELTFEGLWSRHSHPKDFPKSWDTRFSDVIGASHAANYSFWEYMHAASPGLRQVAENGTTRTLEKELKDNSQHIRTIIKARGIGWPNVTGKTFAVFRVDRDHHLMSIVSHIDPSPDWFVGISGLELCTQNCSWIENVKFDLYPWDAGTNDGITYYSKGQEMRNELIRQITSSFPNSKDSPFYDPTGAEMKPIARIYLTRQRLYEKFSCNPHESNKNTDCATIPINAPGPCGVSCGRGVRLQQLEYVDPKKAKEARCTDSLTKRFHCENPACPPSRGNEETDDPKCETTEWSDWSACPPCGGLQTRDRSYKYEEYSKYCTSLSGRPVLQETLPCEAEETSGCSKEPPEDIPQHCKLTEWSDWTPCSVTCGNGTRIRTRLFISRDFNTRQIDIMNQHRDQREELNEEENADDELAVIAAASDITDCSKYKISQEMQCSNIHADCNISPEDARVICQLPRDEGPCRFQTQHWYFDTESGRCKPFNYGGCRGNKNNFVTQELCEEVCYSVTDDQDTPKSGFGGFSSYSLTHSSTDDASEESTTQPERERHHEKPVDCRVSPWSPWSACSVTCGKGYKYRYRKIEVHPSKNRKACPRLQRKHKCVEPACEEDFVNQMQSDENPTWGEARWIKTIPGEDCVLSEWSPWSSCTKSCGSDRRKVRTRDILIHRTAGGKHCDKRIDHQFCAPIPCVSNHPSD